MKCFIKVHLFKILGVPLRETMAEVFKVGYPGSGFPLYPPRRLGDAATTLNASPHPSQSVPEGSHSAQLFSLSTLSLYQLRKLILQILRSAFLGSLQSLFVAPIIHQFVIS